MERIPNDITQWPPEWLIALALVTITILSL
jgi:hypothetical protein